MGRFWSFAVFDGADPRRRRLSAHVRSVADGRLVRLVASGHWLPENINEHGRVIDSLFMFILWLTGVVFVATEVALFWFLWKYDADDESASR